jgi:acetoacetate decarboxylase
MVAIKTYAREVVDDVMRTRGPYRLFRGTFRIRTHDDKVRQFQRIPVGITKPCVEHELKLEARASIGKFTLHKVFVREAFRVCRATYTVFP